jgi:hypothetical protein
MQGAWVGTQLSTREGFEVKVTEVSLMSTIKADQPDHQQRCPGDRL